MASYFLVLIRCLEPSIIRPRLWFLLVLPAGWLLWSATSSPETPYLIPIVAASLAVGLCLCACVRAARLYLEGQVLILDKIALLTQLALACACGLFLFVMLQWTAY